MLAATTLVSLFSLTNWEPAIRKYLESRPLSKIVFAINICRQKSPWTNAYSLLTIAREFWNLCRFCSGFPTEFLFDFTESWSYRPCFPLAKAKRLKYSCNWNFYLPTYFTGQVSDYLISLIQAMATRIWAFLKPHIFFHALAENRQVAWW